MNRHCIPGLTMSNSPDGNFSAEVWNTKRWPGLARTSHYHANAPVLTREETGRYDLAGKISVVF